MTAEAFVRFIGGRWEIWATAMKAFLWMFFQEVADRQARLLALTLRVTTGEVEGQVAGGHDVELLRFSLALIQSWIGPLGSLSRVFTNSLVFSTSDRLFEKLKDLEEGIMVLLKVRNTTEEDEEEEEVYSVKRNSLSAFSWSIPGSGWLSEGLNTIESPGPELEDAGFRGSPLLRLTYDKFDVNLRSDDSLMKNYGLLACFKKDMHKVETYLKLMKCRRFVESNCTL
ncbi:SOMA1 protein, partial [Polypterus senegalus]